MIKNDQTCVKKAAKRLKKGCKEAAKRLQKGCKKIFMLPWLGMSVSQTFQPSRFSRESPVFWFILPVSQFLSKSPSFWNNSKTNIKVLETHVDFSDTCGNGLINLSFVSKSKSFFNHGWQSVSFCNSLPQSSFRSPSSQLFYKRLLQGGGGGSGSSHSMLVYVPVKTSLFSNSRGQNVCSQSGPGSPKPRLT